ncbi:MAG TPA: SCO1664 family protein [Tepidiformaceae bacterium]|nr:SCO1664 family protein [Tepidiformaceae bacterium]
MAEALQFEEAERLLREASFEDCRPVWYSSNAVYLAQMCFDGQVFGAIYKPGRGERPLWDFPEGLYPREVAAYRLSQLLGWQFIPPTVLRDGPEGPGSLQLYIQHDPEQHFFVQRDQPQFRSQLQRMCVFDLIANNADRKGGHCLLDEDGRIWGIDHGLCFHEQYKLRSVIWDWAGEPVTPALVEEVREAAATIAEDAEMQRLVTAREMAALQARIARFCESKRYPLPGSERHYPWPLV